MGEEITAAAAAVGRRSVAVVQVLTVVALIVAAPYSARFEGTTLGSGLAARSVGFAAAVVGAVVGAVVLLGEAVLDVAKVVVLAGFAELDSSTMGSKTDFG